MPPALHIENLVFKYPGSSWKLSVRELTLAPGEQILLTAGSGRGKSTLLALIAGLVEPDGGAVKVNGADVHGLAGPQRDRFRGRHIGMIFQTLNLLQGFTALENVQAALMLIGKPPSEQEVIARALLKSLEIARPEALVEQLSVGQQQRVAVARAVACEPALVLADEPTASLDPENAQAAMDLIQGVCREKKAALLCVSHDPGMIPRFERRERLDALGGEGL